MSPREASPAARRNAVLTALLPGLLIGCAYAAIQRPRLLQQVDRAARELADAQRLAPADADVAEALAGVQVLREQVDARRRLAAAATATLAVPGTASAALDARDDHGESALAAILVQSGMLVLAERPADLATAAAAQRFAGAGTKRVRTLAIRGAYADMQRALAEIATLDRQLRVFDLTMQRDAGEQGGLSWLLTIG